MTSHALPGACQKRMRHRHETGVYFTTPHFDGYPGVLVRLAQIGVPELEELITEAWLAQAPKTLAKAFLQNDTYRRCPRDPRFKPEKNSHDRGNSTLGCYIFTRNFTPTRVIRVQSEEFL
jgi:hypothetical protein